MHQFSWKCYNFIKYVFKASSNFLHMPLEFVVNPIFIYSLINLSHLSLSYVILASLLIPYFWRPNFLFGYFYILFSYVWPIIISWWLLLWCLDCFCFSRTGRFIVRLFIWECCLFLFDNYVQIYWDGNQWSFMESTI